MTRKIRILKLFGFSRLKDFSVTKKIDKNIITPNNPTSTIKVSGVFLETMYFIPQSFVVLNVIGLNLLKLTK